MDPVCPNCRLPVGIDGKSVSDVNNKSYHFHDRCFIDVWTGWSGSIPIPMSGESSQDLYDRCMRINFKCVGIDIKLDRNQQ